jgi:hypothetical protein
MTGFRPPARGGAYVIDADGEARRQEWTREPLDPEHPDQLARAERRAARRAAGSAGEAGRRRRPRPAKED